MNNLYPTKILLICMAVMFFIGCSKKNYGDLTVSLLNSMTDQEISIVTQTNAKFNRVELPPLLSIKINVPDRIRSVKFILSNGLVIFDNEPPFILTEEQAKIISLSSEMGLYQFQVYAYRDSGAEGSIAGYLKQTLVISKEGMDTDFKRMNDIETMEWLSDKADSVLQKKLFYASNTMQMPYRIFIPKYYSEKVKYPLLIFLHGRGERGADNGPQIYNNRFFLGKNSIISPNSQNRFPALVIVPQCSDKTVIEEWAHWVGNTSNEPFNGLGKDGSYIQHEQPSASGQAFWELLNNTLRNYNIDTNRVYISGISMGGFGTWEFSCSWPEIFAAAVPMAGYSDPSKAVRLRHIPFWIFHGNADQWNPVQGSRIMYEKLLELGADVRYTEYENSDHNTSFDLAFQEELLLPWIFSQRRK